MCRSMVPIDLKRVPPLQGSLIHSGYSVVFSDSPAYYEGAILTIHATRAKLPTRVMLTIRDLVIASLALF